MEHFNLKPHHLGTMKMTVTLEQCRGRGTNLPPVKNPGITLQPALHV